MSLKDRFDKFIDYFTEDGEETTNYQTQQEETVSPAISSSKELPAPAQSGSAKDANITRLHVTVIVIGLVVLRDFQQIESESALPKP